MLQKSLDSLVENAKRRVAPKSDNVVSFLENLSDFSGEQSIAKMCAEKCRPEDANKNASAVALVSQELTIMLQKQAFELFNVKKFRQHTALGFSWAEYCESYLFSNEDSVNGFIRSFIDNEALGGELFSARCEVER